MSRRPRRAEPAVRRERADRRDALRPGRGGPAAPREGRDRARAVPAAGRGGSALSEEDGLTKTATTTPRRRSGRSRCGQVEGTPARSSWRRSTTMPRRSPKRGSARRSPERSRTATRGSFGRKINEPWIWWPLAAIFFVGLASLRRPLSMRNLDLVVLLSFAASWWFFNQGQIFTSVPLAYPPLIYLLGRMIWLDVRGRSPGALAASFWPVWVLVAATVTSPARDRPECRGLERDRRRLRRRDRRAAGRERDRSPYGNFPVREGAECGPPDSEGNVRDRVQTNSRCETANDRGDTYGPIAYIAYVPGYLAAGWSGKWDRLPACQSHLASVRRVDARRPRAGRLALRSRSVGGDPHVRMGRVPLYDIRHELQLERHDSARDPRLGVLALDLGGRARALRQPCVVDEVRPFLVPLGFVSGRPQAAACTRAVRSGVRGRHLARLLGTAARAGPGPHAARVFWDRTFGWRLGRDSFFSVWNWASTPVTPISTSSQVALKELLLVGAIVLGFVPAGSRRSSSPRSPP